MKISFPYEQQLLIWLYRQSLGLISPKLSLKVKIGPQLSVRNCRKTDSSIYFRKTYM